MIKRLQVQILAGAAGELSFLELTLCSDSYLVSTPPPPPHASYRSGTVYKSLVILPKMQMAGYAQTCIHPWPNKARVGKLCHCPGIVWEPIQKWAHTQLVRNVQPQSSRPTEPLWTDPGIKVWNYCAQANLHFKKRKGKKSTSRSWMVERSLQILASEKKPTTTTSWYFEPSQPQTIISAHIGA